MRCREKENSRYSLIFQLNGETRSILRSLWQSGQVNAQFWWAWATYAIHITFSEPIIFKHFRCWWLLLRSFEKVTEDI